MTISYKWISEYIPVVIDPEEISKILTSIGLEVESMEPYESIRGGLKGLVVGEVIECRQHPGADKLKLTKVDTGDGQLLQIVCGAPNVAEGQKVIVARVGTTIFPAKGEALTMKVAKIRGEESYGMICAEDEIGIGESHAGIVILPQHLRPGTPLTDYYQPYHDWIYEIGLTPNRMDAMSHLGVAKDICAYLSHHTEKPVQVKFPPLEELVSTAGQTEKFSVRIENTSACERYSGVAISGISVKESPKWLQDKLRSIGQRPINNIVDITNYILHDTGQPLHAFDSAAVSGNTIIVKNLPEGTLFKTLDDKERKLSGEDLMICDGNGKGMCIAGVFGGAESGVKLTTTNIFLESAWFNPVDIRKTSFRHGLRTDAAARFEKNVDISNTPRVLKRAAKMIVDIAGGRISSAVIDEYPAPRQKNKVSVRYDFIKKLSGKYYGPPVIKDILENLGFETIGESEADLTVAVPFSKPDITLPADIVEEIMRIDGYDNIGIPSHITLSPSVGALKPEQVKKQKATAFLVGAGFSEIFTNSITNAAYFGEKELESSVRLLNNLSAVHNVMRPSMLQTGLETVAYNLNRKNSDLRLFEFGKTYYSGGAGAYFEKEQLCLYVTGNRKDLFWKGKPEETDIFYGKGVVEALLRVLGLDNYVWQLQPVNKMQLSLVITEGKDAIVEAGMVSRGELIRFDIRQPVFYANIHWQALMKIAALKPISYTPLPNQMPVYRDLAMVVAGGLPYEAVESAVRNIQLPKLREMRLFDVFESEKIGAGKKSLAVNFTFQDEEKTLTDKEIDSMMTKIMRTLEQELKAEIRKGS